MGGLPSGKRLQKTMEHLWKIHPFSSWVNQLFEHGHFQVRKLFVDQAGYRTRQLSDTSQETLDQTWAL
jgi:hypothetical protein